MGNDKISDAEYIKYYRMVFRFCLRLTGGNQHDAEDLTGEVFQFFFAEQDRLDFEMPAALVTWLYRTAKNKWMKIVRHAMRKPPDMDETDLFSNQFEGDKEEKQYRAYIKQIERSLSGSDLELFRAIIIEKREYPDIAERLGISEQTLRVRWFRLRQKIRPTVEKMIFH